MSLLPLFLDLRSKPVLLVGGGSVARAKLAALREARADLRLVATRFTTAFRHEARGLRLQERPFESADLDGVQLVIAATNDPAVNAAIADDARLRGIWINAVDDPAACDAYFASTLRRGPVQLAISTHGAFPGLSRSLRLALETLLPDDALLRDFAALRARLRDRLPDAAQRTATLRALLHDFETRHLSLHETTMTSSLETPAQESAAEGLKRDSRFLRGTLEEELASADPGFSSDAQQLLKPHGFYQQKDRDRKGDPANPPVLMVRGSIPGGRLNAAQYLAWDRIADRFGDGSIRLTTRQSIELHRLHKGDAKPALKALQAALQSTKGACGDVVRNVTQAPNPWGRADLAQLDAVATQLALHFEARSNAYAEIWLDGERVDPEAESEPLLGKAYLPRKFKIAVTAAGENLVDLYTNDLGFAATFGADGILDGFFVFAGGGMGMTHNDATTFPRLADLLGWIAADQLLPLAEAVVGAQRDHGNRADRKRARLKYLIASKGLTWFRGEVESRWGRSFEVRGLPAWRTSSVLGWIAREDGTWALGFHVEAGRIADRPAFPLKSALRDIVEDFGLDAQITPDQDLILLGILDEDRADIEDILEARGVDPVSPSKLRDRALACPALPFCGLAIAEAERALPEVLDHLEAALERHGLAQRGLVFRMTGCANGCARPYSAELALAGQTPGRYALHAGGSEEGDRLAFEIVQKVAIADLPRVFDRLIGAWRSAGDGAFGDFAARAGAAALRDALEAR